MLTATPAHVLSSTFVLDDDGAERGRLRTSAVREKGVLEVDGTAYRLYRTGCFSGAFVLERDGQRLAEADKPSALRNRFVVTFGGTRVELRRDAVVRRAFSVWDDGRRLGGVVPRHAFTRTADVDLPADWPLPLRAFVLWLVLVIWTRDAASAGSGGS